MKKTSRITASRRALLVLITAMFGAASGSFTAAAAPPEVHALSWERLGEWRGYALNDVRIVDAYVSERFSTTRPDGRAVPTELAEVELAGPSGLWRARCTYEIVSLGQVDVACDFVPDDGTAAHTLVLDASGGSLLGPVELTIRPKLANLDALELQFDRADSPRVATWEADTRGITRRETRHPLSLFDRGATAAELEASTLVALVTLLPNYGEVANTTPRLDAYPLVPGEPRADRGQPASLGVLVTRGDPRATLLQRHLQNTQRIDREAGARVSREPWTARVAIGLQFGLAAFESDRGGLESFRLGSVDVQAGLRFDRFLLLVAIGLHPNDVSTRPVGPESLRLRPDATGASLGLQGTYALPVFASLEVVFGLRLGLRARFIDLAGDATSLSQGGMSVAPVVGFQIPAWRINDLGSRLLFYIHAAPEIRLWTDPSGSSPSSDAPEWPRIREDLGRGDFVFRLEGGLRFEL